MHSDDPAVLVYVPIEQDVHIVVVATEVYVPSGQREHTVEPSVAAYDPNEQ